MTRKKRRALLCMLAVPLLALAPRSEESLPASAAEPAAMPEKYVALTFDDGPWPEITEQLLDGLAERGAKATFFLIGEQIAGHEDTVRRMADEGHQVGSHTFTHMDLSRGDPAERLRVKAKAQPVQHKPAAPAPVHRLRNTRRPVSQLLQDQIDRLNGDDQ